jgi:hypothetical protein
VIPRVVSYPLTVIALIVCLMISGYVFSTLDDWITKQVHHEVCIDLPHGIVCGPPVSR